MRVFRILLIALVVIVFGRIAVAATAPAITTPDATNWTPGTGGYQGTSVAVLLGDPSKPGMYIMRLKIPAGTNLPPHVHGDTENVTVISGTLWVGLGKTVDKNTMKPLAAGTFATIPANFPHYAMTKDETVIQIEGMGPESMTPVK